MKKTLLIILLLSVAALPSIAQDCDRYSKLAPSQQLLFYMQDNDVQCVKKLLGKDKQSAPPLYWKNENMCVDLLFYWVHKGPQDTFETIARSLIMHGADMTQTYCKRSAIGAAADLAITDITSKGYFDDGSERIRRFEYLLALNTPNNVINRIQPDFLQYSITKTGRITDRFVLLLLEYGIHVMQDDINYAKNHGYWNIYNMLRVPEGEDDEHIISGENIQDNVFFAVNRFFSRLNER